MCKSEQVMRQHACVSKVHMYLHHQHFVCSNSLAVSLHTVINADKVRVAIDARGFFGGHCLPDRGFSDGSRVPPGSAWIFFRGAWIFFGPRFRRNRQKKSVWKSALKSTVKSTHSFPPLVLSVTPTTLAPQLCQPFAHAGCHLQILVQVTFSKQLSITIPNFSVFTEVTYVLICYCLLFFTYPK